MGNNTPNSDKKFAAMIYGPVAKVPEHLLCDNISEDLKGQNDSASESLGCNQDC